MVGPRFEEAASPAAHGSLRVRRMRSCDPSCDTCEDVFFFSCVLAFLSLRSSVPHVPHWPHRAQLKLRYTQDDVLPLASYVRLSESLRACASAAAIEQTAVHQVSVCDSPWLFRCEWLAEWVVSR
jgi:hypothetical protein